MSRRRFRTTGTKTTRRQRFGDHLAPVRTGGTGTGNVQRPRESNRERHARRYRMAMLYGLDGPARYDSPMPPGWVEEWEEALAATDNKAVRCMPRGYLYWERSAQHSRGRSLED